MSYQRIDDDDSLTVSDDMPQSLLCSLNVAPQANHHPHHSDSEIIGLTSEAIGHNPLALLSTYASNEAKEDIRCMVKSIDDKRAKCRVKNDEEMGIQGGSRPGSKELPVESSPIRGGKKRKQYSLTSWEIFSFAQGHVMNDMCAACWFTYLLVFLMESVRLTATNAGIVLISGQIADAIATSVVGVISDNTKPLEIPLFWRGMEKYIIGPRKLWFMAGTIIVFITFLCVFAIDPIPKEIENQTSDVIYYAIAASLFNVGWAIVQISHLAMIPDLAKDDYTRVSLVSFRYTFTIISNSTIFLLYLYGESKYQSYEESQKQSIVFRMITYITLGVGAFSAFILATGVHEPLDKYICYKENEASEGYTLVRNEIEESDTSDKIFIESVSNGKLLNESILDESSTKNAVVPVNDECLDRSERSNISALSAPSTAKSTKKWYHWLYEGQLYMVAMVYMCSRIIVNFSQVYIYYYCAYTLNRTGSYSSLTPLTIYISSFMASLVLDRINRAIGRHGSFYIGSSLVVIASFFMFLLENNASFLGDFHVIGRLYIYPIVVILGLGNATVMITSVSMEHDLVGDETQTGAFIYGILSFTDKLSCGILVFLAQVLLNTNCPEKPEDCSQSQRCADYMRYIMVIPLFAAALVGSLFTCFVKKEKAH